jgi:arylsulfate sulfotransferase
VIPSLAVKQAPTGPIGLLLHSGLFTVSYATDLSDNLVWYYPSLVTFLTQAEPGGRFVSLISPTYASPQAYDPSQEIFREFDVAGNTLRETNAARLNEQLAPMGKRIGALHHDARALPDGTIAVLASTEQMLTNVQGSGTVDVIGDMILVLDRDMQVKWVWDAFDHLDTHRMATLNEVCPAPGGGCPPLYLGKKANDWVHGNAVQFLADGSLLYSSRHQDWVYKIDYANGTGSGSVIWKMGPGGDFQIQSSDPSPWFSHQHDAQFTADGNTTLTVFDDGNLRVANNSKAHSRGQALMVDEKNRVVTLIINTDLGGFSFALGSAQQLAAGGYVFGAGWYVPANDSQVVEIDTAGEVTYSLSVRDPEYRTYKLSDLYTP